MECLGNIFKNIITTIIIPVLLALVGAYFINKYLFFVAIVPTGSMLPTIQLQEKLFITSVWDTNTLERGDIVVFDSDELGEILIKRLIGLPGDKVEIKLSEQGVNETWINGEIIEESYVKYQSSFEEQSFTVPEDHFFFLGDNRSASLDARFWENPYIHKDDIKGKATYTTRFQRIES